MDYSVETIKILEGALENDRVKVEAYAQLLAEKLEKDGEERKAKMIRKRLDGSYKKSENIIVACE